MEDMAACKCARSGLTQRLQAHRALLLTRFHRLLAFRWINRLGRIRIHIALDSFTVTNGHAKPIVSSFLPVLPLAGLTAVEDKLTTGAGLEQQVRAVAGADTAVGALSLVARAGLAGTRRCKGRVRAKCRVCEEGDKMGMSRQYGHIQKKPYPAVYLK
jgi:hypothetical protein